MDVPVKKVNVEQPTGFPVPAIVAIAVGGYLILFFIILMIRKIIISKGHNFCPTWCSELTVCQPCCCINDNNEPECIMRCAAKCNCSLPNKRSCMDSICPTKQWCDKTFCCCLSEEPMGVCCNCSCCNCGKCDGYGESCGCEECCDCAACKEYFNDCKCQCCAQPDAVDCCCLEINLKGSNRNNANAMNAGYNNQGYMNHPGMVINQQPGMGPPGMFPSHQQLGMTPSAMLSSQQQQPIYPGVSGRYPSGQMLATSQQPTSSHFSTAQGRSSQQMFAASPQTSQALPADDRQAGRYPTGQMLPPPLPSRSGVQ